MQSHESTGHFKTHAAHIGGDEMWLFVCTRSGATRVRLHSDHIHSHLASMTGPIVWRQVLAVLVWDAGRCQAVAAKCSAGYSFLFQTPAYRCTQSKQALLKMNRRTCVFAKLPDTVLMQTYSTLNITVIFKRSIMCGFQRPWVPHKWSWGWTAAEWEEIWGEPPLWARDESLLWDAAHSVPMATREYTQIRHIKHMGVLLENEQMAGIVPAWQAWDLCAVM